MALDSARADTGHHRNASSRPVVRLPLDELAGPVCPRSAGVDEAHARLLAESVEALPPIVVQAGTLRIIDGMHRVRAAVLTGRSDIAAVLSDESDDDAYLSAVAANIAHGLPLTLADRRAAAARVVAMHPEWSDRRVAKAVGLSGKTVGVLRRAADGPVADVRVGTDGRVRPIDAERGRQIALELLSSRPEASLREVASAAGVSPSTVRGVRDRIRRGETADARPVRDNVRPIKPRAADDIDCGRLLHNLSHDPSLRYTEVGRTLLRWLHNQPATVTVVEELPPHCLPIIAQLTRKYASRWADFAEQAERRARVEPA
ncbi:ParB N-terminal domain-containing protein [Dactylosporangium aurantiacum]|uniref:ParB N-terminal domain-containing protein n=1 Tax=Dactylosporangium aurantiacum TaxID=35754 RepID=A0A9Q9IS31_9ACTN|nr:ParB/RepB/Spo0J family partition protein [Dactylosporangium aurantiacum]MDG6103901.1 ParB/RepB/Spo0J family partition protein [Dactylosporangium aurantiacum]UWZ58910.1 ParB N-terminal domain-containing protein [Dactylosporangium aurantiacum]